MPEPTEIHGAATVVRERLVPAVSDRSYICLADLRAALGRHASKDKLTILDLGCGTSPYQTLFPNADYKKADLPGIPGIHYVISSPDTIPGNAFDLVLSTQVLEHVRHPEEYLSLALRVLKPGGKLVLTTHGMFEEHACPEDYYRWTALGLETLAQKCGFNQVHSWKVTTRQRAAAFLLLRHFGLLGLKRKTLFGFCAAIINRFVQAAAPLLHRWLDRHAAECCIVESRQPGHELYVGLMIEGLKP